MSYGRIVTPRIYTCTMRHLLARGVASTSWSKIAGTLNTGSDINDLLNPRPGQRCSFDTSANAATHIILQFDMGVSTFNPINFVAILNHNLAEADALEPTLRHNTVVFTGPGEGTAVTPLTYPWGGVDTGVVSENGVLGFTFAEVTNKRYWALEIPDNANFSATDLEIGCILIGCYYDFPYSPDLEVSAPHEFGGVKVLESSGGQGWGFASHLGGPGDTSTIFAQPFRLADYRRRYHSRRAWDVEFSRIEDTLLRSQYQERGLLQCATIQDVWERTCGSLIPFIWQTDNSTSGLAGSGDSAWARFDMDELKAEQRLSPKVWRYRLNIREEF
jgi:hypothetical protein